MKHYKGAWTVIKEYFTAYGGWRAVFCSPYFQLSTIITFICLQVWQDGSRWKELIVQIMPNLLGFSIGAFAILFSSFQGKIGPFMFEREEGDKFTPAEELSATFMHFIMVQALTLIFGIISYSGLGATLVRIFTKMDALRYIDYPLFILYQCFKGFVFLLFIYSIMMLVSATAAIFRTITWEAIANNE
ncbi:hypothetical protein BB934_18400 [Microvirga ossetica]|uniref:Uncharacterized protein n=1 Tax=Microvirga ossetica TaxID=1882682 RepID=A0A1B2EJ10_9HYPH|nr:hypothetical protein [Microvirga ossetica]ANY79954.1 hypothetical protein BB934_18400 [Microvirga ossetica]